MTKKLLNACLPDSRLCSSLRAVATQQLCVCVCVFCSRCPFLKGAQSATQNARGAAPNYGCRSLSRCLSWTNRLGGQTVE